MIIKNKFTGESKGLGYVRYYKPSQAALAIENCDKGRSAKLIYLFINPGRSSCMNIKYTEWLVNGYSCGDFSLLLTLSKGYVYDLKLWK